MDDFQVRLEVPVEWRNIDTAFHVNNVVYIEWVESARVEYFMQLNDGKLMREDDISPIVAWQDCKYIRPVSFPDTVILGVKKSEILDDRMVLETRIFSKSDNRIVAISTQHIMAYNVKLKRKAALPLNWIYNEA